MEQAEAANLVAAVLLILENREQDQKGTEETVIIVGKDILLIIKAVAEADRMTASLGILREQAEHQFGAEAVEEEQLLGIILQEETVLLVAQAAQAVRLEEPQELLLVALAAEAAYPQQPVAQAQQVVLSLPYLMEHKNGLCYR
jgi:hypothetical protein